MKYHQEHLIDEHGYHAVPTYIATDFDRMIAETKPDVVVVATTDATHHQYILRALELGCDVITEKPITTEAENCRDILNAVERSGHGVRVTFNLRWAPGPTKVRELIEAGTIGRW